MKSAYPEGAVDIFFEHFPGQYNYRYNVLVNDEPPSFGKKEEF